MKKNNIDTKQLISEMRQMLGTKRMTVEGLVYGEDGEEMMGGNEMGGNGDSPEAAAAPEAAAPEADAAAAQEMGSQNQQIPGMNPKEENPLDGDPEITELITNIRVMTLKGLTKLANNPETAQYDLLKKIFLQIDKSVEDKIDPEK